MVKSLLHLLGTTSCYRALASVVVFEVLTEGSVGNVVDMSEDCKNGLSEACLFQVVVFLFFVLRTIWIERQHRQRPPEFS